MGSNSTSSDEITFSDYLGLNAALFEWADSYDSKDWKRLSRCIAPTLRVRKDVYTPTHTHTQRLPARHSADPPYSQEKPLLLIITLTPPNLTLANRDRNQIDYRSFLDKIWPAMPAEEFIAMISDKAVLGNPLLRTQHFVGGSRWEKVSDTEVIGHHQLRVPHQVYTDATLKEVKVKGHAHSYNMHWYRKVDGVWKFAGLNPDIRWSEYEFEKVFADGRENFGEEAEEAAPAKVEGKGAVTGDVRELQAAVSV